MQEENQKIIIIIIMIVVRVGTQNIVLNPQVLFVYNIYKEYTETLLNF